MGMYFFQGKERRESCGGGRWMGRAETVSDMVRRNKSASGAFITECGSFF